MKEIVKKIIKKVTPQFILNSFSIKKEKFNRFIKVHDYISNSEFNLFLREDSFMEKVILEKGLYGEWEKESLKIWAELSKRADVILDIGANTGILSMLAQVNNPSANIIAVEPVNINHEVLQKNIRKNNFGIKAEKVALSDKAGTAKMYMLKDRLNYMTSVNDDRYADAPHVKGDFEVVEIEVPIVPFSTIAEKYSLDKIDLIKLDVEGHEIAVLQTMLPWISRHKPAILIEVIGDDNAAELNNIFGALGYLYISIDEKNISRQVDQLWDNHHHNFLITDEATIALLKNRNLVE